MKPEQHARVREVFFEASEAPEAERDRVLDELCAGDAEVREQVCALLAAGSNARTGHGWLETPVLGRVIPDGMADETQAMAVGEVGPYRIIRCIGEGGMGVVYEAEQRSPQRRVALKLVRPGLGSTHIVRRFQHESEILGRLEHPGIARIYEAGVAPVEFSDGSRVVSPFFAMEFVDGRPLTEVGAGLSIDERLELFAKVCDAVEYAHRRGVIHRDLKPANILVEESDGATERRSDEGKDRSADPSRGGSSIATSPRHSIGSPKILDFGVARVTGEDAAGSMKHSVLTQASSLVGTLAYMSPEQLSGDPSRVDTRSDVYALGACLYELLAGRPAVDVAGKPLNEAVRLVAEQQPARLGTLDPSLRGEVEIIVRKALEKSPNDRYASAAALAADIRAYLRHDAIAAYPPSGLYQLRKFARRNRALVVAGSLGVGALAVGAALATVGLFEARRQRDIAKEEATKAVRERDWAKIHQGSDRAAVNFLRRIVSAMKPLKTENGNLRDIFERAVADDNEFRAQPLPTASVDDVAADFFADIGETDRALALWQRSVQGREIALGADHPEALRQRAYVTNVRMRLGVLSPAEAETHLREIYAAILARPDARPEDIGTVEQCLAQFYMDRKDFPESEKMLLSAIEHLCGSDVDDLGCSGARSVLGTIYYVQHDAVRADAQLTEALAILRRHPTEEYEDSDISVLYLLSATRGILGRFDEALELITEAIQLNTKRHPEKDRMTDRLRELEAEVRKALDEKARAAQPSSGEAPDK